MKYYNFQVKEWREKKMEAMQLEAELNEERQRQMEEKEAKEKEAEKRRRSKEKEDVSDFLFFKDLTSLNTS